MLEFTRQEPIEELVDGEMLKHIYNTLLLAKRMYSMEISCLAFHSFSKIFYLTGKAIEVHPLEKDDNLLSINHHGIFSLNEVELGKMLNSSCLSRLFINASYFASVPIYSSKYCLSAQLCVMNSQPILSFVTDLSLLEILASQFTSLWGASYNDIKYNTESNKLNESEQILNKQKSFYENILNSLPIDIAVFDDEHKYLFVNNGAISDKELREFIIGKDDFDYCKYRNRSLEVAEKRRAMFLDIKRTGKTIKWEDSLLNPLGETVTHLRRFYPVYDDLNNLMMVIGFGVDITERKKLEEKQAALLDEITTKNTQMFDFINIISHNLRTPVGNIGMLARFITESDNIAEQKELLSEIEPVVNNILSTLDQLVDSIKVSQTKNIANDVNDFRSCFLKIQMSLQVQLTRLGAIIETDFSVAPKVTFPSSYLESIFLNLLSNAIKYQSPKRKLELKISTIKTENDIILSFRDNGLGIDMKKHGDKIFKIGSVFHNHPQAKGFGLFMTKNQLEAMNGEIWVESIPDEGATFFIKFTNQ